MEIPPDTAPGQSYRLGIPSQNQIYKIKNKNTVYYINRVYIKRHFNICHRNLVQIMSSEELVEGKSEEVARLFAIGDEEEENEEETGHRVGRKPPMSVVDQQRLRAVFIRKQAEKWTTRERKHFIECLLSDSLFKHLNKSQIMRRHNLFTTEVVLRRRYGAQFYHATNAMSTIEGPGKFIPMNILVILKEWRQYFVRINEYNSLPDHLDKFLQRCTQAFVDWTPRDNDNGIDKVLSIEDMARVFSFMEYIKNILMPSYANAWASYAVVEVESPEKMNGRPDLFLADLELNLNLLRRSWVESPFSIPQLAFFEDTFMFEVFESEILYGIYERFDSDEGYIIFPPEFVRQAVEDNDLTSLKRMLFSVFELLVWKAYVHNIFIDIGTLDIDDDSDNESDNDITLQNDPEITEDQQVEGYALKGGKVANTSERDIIQYLVGAALRQALSCLQTVPPKKLRIQDCQRYQRNIVESFILTKERALEEFSPRDLRTSMTRETTPGAFFYPNLEVYNLFLSAYENHIKPALENPIAMGLLKDQSESFLEYSIVESAEYYRFYDMVFECCANCEFVAERYEF